MKKFNDDDICRDLPPDVMGLIHDIAYMDRRSVKGNIVERAQDILRERSDDDLRNKLMERERFMLYRAIDAMCDLCNYGTAVEEVPRSGGTRYVHRSQDGTATDCDAHPVHRLLASWRLFASGGVVKNETRTLGDIPCCDGMPSIQLKVEEAPPMSDSAMRTHRKMQELIKVAIQLNAALLARHHRAVEMMDRTRRLCFCSKNPPMVSYESDHEQQCRDAFAALQAFEKLCYGSEVVDKVKSGS